MTLRALIVDDEPLARARLRTLLGECPAPRVQVEGEAGNAAQALALLARQTFDVALLDVHMPGADGMALARSLQALPQPPAIVFVTAHAEHAVQAFEIEAVDYLTKPVRLEQADAGAAEGGARAAAPGAGGRGAGVPDDPGPRAHRARAAGRGAVPEGRAEVRHGAHRHRAATSWTAALNELEEKPRRAFPAHAPQCAGHAATLVRALEKHHDPEEGEGWAVRLQGVDEPLAVSRRQLPAVREAIGAA
jgi:two-component system response regulator AlgR